MVAAPELSSLQREMWKGLLMSRFSRFGLVAATAASSLFLVGCPPKDVIELSNSSYDFELNDTPWTFQVSNADARQVPELEFEVETNRSWLVCSPRQGTSTGPQDKKTITVTVNREGLSAGPHRGKITVSGTSLFPYYIPKTIDIGVTSEGGSEAGGWSLHNLNAIYTAPYLVEFSFSLRDGQGHAINAEPAQFQMKCMEDGIRISSETGSHLAKGANKQLLVYLVLDYTLSMADTRINGDADHDGISDAIEAMESAAKNVFLDSLSADAQVGIYEFHREDRDPQKVAGFSADKAYLKQRIDAIWAEYASYPAASRCWDALYAATEEFGAQDDLRDEQRAIIFLSDGRDESSGKTYNEVIEHANDRQIDVYCIGFGAELDLTALQVITSQTGGEYYSAQTVSQLATRFTQIVEDLGGQYILRWATLKRSKETFLPSFALTYSTRTETHTVRHTASKRYRPTDYAGDPLLGTLRLVPSTSGTNTTLFLRAIYVPRYITQLVLHVKSPYAFDDPTLVEAADGGLCAAGWDLISEDDVLSGGKVISLQTGNPADIFTAIPYAAFGPILRFEFDGVIEDLATLFDELAIDNDIYSGGQSFTLEWPPEGTQK